MRTGARRVSALSVADFEVSPVWQFAGSDDDGEPLVRPVKRIPVATTSGKIVGTRVTLGNGDTAWAIIDNIDICNALAAEHFLSLSIERAGAWFHLARYFDVDYLTRGPSALARFLGLTVAEVFPVSYDLRPYVKSGAAILVGAVQETPKERLSEAELMTLAIP